MVKGFTPAFSCSDGYLEIFYYTSLPDEVSKTLGTQADIKWRVLVAWFS
jgi:hypothetical protein